MRTRRLAILSLTSLAVAAPMAAAQGVPHAFTLDGPKMGIAPVAGTEGTYVVASRLWATTQQVHWFTTGPPAAIGSVPAPRFARLLAKRAGGDAARAPLAHIMYERDGRIAHFLATVAAAAPTLGSPGTPALRLTLTAMSPEQLQAVAAGGGLFARTAKRCLATQTTPPGAACTSPARRAQSQTSSGRRGQASRIVPGLPAGAVVTTLRNVTTRFIVTDPDGI